MDFLRSPTDPLGGGGWTLDFSEGQIDPQMRGNHIKIACKSLENTHFSPTRCAFGGSLGTFRGGWTLDFSESPTDPPGGGGWTLDFSESPTDPLGGGGLDLGLLKRANPGTRGGVVQSDPRIIDRVNESGDSRCFSKKEARGSLTANACEYNSNKQREACCLWLK